jgi:hypothetical protein
MAMARPIGKRSTIKESVKGGPCTALFDLIGRLSPDAEGYHGAVNCANRERDD